MPTWKVSPGWTQDVLETHHGILPEANPSGMNNDNLDNFLDVMKKYTNAGKVFSNPIISTYSNIFINTASSGFYGGVLNHKGEVHYIPYYPSFGLKMDKYGTLSTYSLVFTSDTIPYATGAVSPNGDVYFIGGDHPIIQKVSINGTVSTLSGYTHYLRNYGSTFVDSKGTIHCIIDNKINQTISVDGTLSTYSMLFQESNAFSGGVLTPNGDVHFIPFAAFVGQKMDTSGNMSTYSLIYTSTITYPYAGGVLAPNGDVHFVPYDAPVGQKVNANGTVSTYSLVHTGAQKYSGGVLSADGEIHFVPRSNDGIGQKISLDGTVSTYSLIYTDTYFVAGGLLDFNGDIHFIPSANNTIGMKIKTTSAKIINFPNSPFFSHLI